MTSTKRYLDTNFLRSFDAAKFRSTDPYPWANPQGTLTPDGYRELLTCMPDVGMFTGAFGGGRKHGQYAHERYVLEYTDGIALPAPWQAFVNELMGDEYRQFIANLLGHSHFKFRFHWHYTPRSCSVSPHCDSKTKLGSQIFYMNDESWNPEWGGETVVLDDNGRFSTESNPDWADFDREYPARTDGNRSIIFGRRGNSWHGVKELTCPEGALRKVFIVVFEDYRPAKVFMKRATRLLKGKPMLTDKDRSMY